MHGCRSETVGTSDHYCTLLCTVYSDNMILCLFRPLQHVYLSTIHHFQNSPFSTAYSCTPAGSGEALLRYVLFFWIMYKIYIFMQCALILRSKILRVPVPVLLLYLCYRYRYRYYYCTCVTGIWVHLSTRTYATGIDPVSTQLYWYCTGKMGANTKATPVWKISG